MRSVIIRSDHKVYNGDEGDDLLRFLNAVMYPHKEDLMEVMSAYVDFSENKELWKEAGQVDGLGRRISEKGIQASTAEDLEEQVPQERIIRKLRKDLLLTREKGAV